MKRWSEHLGIPIHLQPAHFPAAEQTATRLVIAAGDSGGDPLALAQAFGCAVWEEQRDIADAATCAAIVQENGTNPALLDRATTPELSTRHAPLPDQALPCGSSGPTTSPHPAHT